MVRTMATEETRDRRSLDERLMFMERTLGWRVTVSTHSASTYDWAEENFPSAYGHWQIVFTKDEVSYAAGFILTGEPLAWVQAKGFSGWRTGVYPTLHDCLDEAERFIRRQAAKEGRTRPERWPDGWEATGG